MGMLFSRVSPHRWSAVSSPVTAVPSYEAVMQYPSGISPEEYNRLLLLGNTAGVPIVVVDAIRSGNIMDPVHMQRAERVNDEWERGVALLTPYLLRQQRVDEERARLRELGGRMGGGAVRVSYDSIRAKIGPQQPAQEGLMLRIQTQEHGYVDMTLTEHEDSIEDCLFDAVEYVPKFQAFLQKQEPVLVFEHGV
jgi:hypothetical protein